MCNAGDTHLAVGPDGQAYVCPAYLNSENKIGEFLGEICIPDRHLFTQAYSLMCKVCSVDHCLRCVYHNKTSTREYGVSTWNVCKLAHVEQRARVRLAQEAKARRYWEADWNDPRLPVVMDPYIVLESERTAVMPLWQQPGLAAGRPEEIEPASILDVIHEVQGIVRAAYKCVQAGGGNDHDYLLEDSPLSRARRRTIEAYRDVKFGPDGPSIRDIEHAVLSAVLKKNI